MGFEDEVRATLEAARDATARALRLLADQVERAFRGSSEGSGSRRPMPLAGEPNSAMGDSREAPLYYALVCVYCEQSILFAEQIDDAELEEMADHLRAEHPDEVRNERAPEFDEVIRHFRLSLARAQDRPAN